MKKLIIIISLISMTSCYVQKDLKPKIQVTHVLAVTEQGDTLRLPISMIKPNVYYNVISYPNRYYGNWYNGYYQPSYNNYRPIYAPSIGSGSSNNNNNTNNNTNNTGSKPAPNPATSEQNADIRKKRGGN